jgi:hypothetical protein
MLVRINLYLISQHPPSQIINSQRRRALVRTSKEMHIKCTDLTSALRTHLKRQSHCHAISTLYSQYCDFIWPILHWIPDGSSKFSHDIVLETNQTILSITLPVAI